MLVAQTFLFDRFFYVIGNLLSNYISVCYLVVAYGQRNTEMGIELLRVVTGCGSLHLCALSRTFSASPHH